MYLSINRKNTHNIVETEKPNSFIPAPMTCVHCFKKMTLFLFYEYDYLACTYVSVSGKCLAPSKARRRCPVPWNCTYSLWMLGTL